MREIKLLVALLFCTLFGAAHADIAVLVHGYNDDGVKWYKKGIVQQLGRAGYIDGGQLAFFRGGIIGPMSAPNSENIVYTVDLPSEAPIMAQANILAMMLQRIRQIAPPAPFTLVGHSAGGLVSRATLVQHPELNISRLVTIATPHRGAPMARIGEMVSNSPMGMMADFMGMDEISDADDLFSDMSPISNNRFLKWLNTRPHPPAAYISLVRRNKDMVVPRKSQDMNWVNALRGQSITIPTPGKHSLNPRDGAILAALLSSR